MRNQEELLEALLNGKIVKRTDLLHNNLYKFIEGYIRIVDENGIPITTGVVTGALAHWANCEIFKKKNWWDIFAEKPGTKVLCWCWDADESSKDVYLVNNVIDDGLYNFEASTGDWFKNVIPLTEEEVSSLIYKEQQ